MLTLLEAEMRVTVKVSSGSGPELGSTVIRIRPRLWEGRREGPRKGRDRGRGGGREDVVTRLPVKANGEFIPTSVHSAG